MVPGARTWPPTAGSTATDRFYPMNPDADPARLIDPGRVRPLHELIPHAHFHVIPRKADDGVRFKWVTKKYGPGEIEKQAEAIRVALR